MTEGRPEGRSPAMFGKSILHNRHTRCKPMVCPDRRSDFREGSEALQAQD